MVSHWCPRLGRLDPSNACRSPLSTGYSFELTERYFFSRDIEAITAVEQKSVFEFLQIVGDCVGGGFHSGTGESIRDFSGVDEATSRVHEEFREFLGEIRVAALAAAEYILDQNAIDDARHVVAVGRFVADRRCVWESSVLQEVIEPAHGIRVLGTAIVLPGL